MGSSSEHAIGYLAMLVAAVFFGSNFVPVKRCRTGDSWFFQFCFCAAVWPFGLAVGAYRGFPQFHPLAMLGGFLWATGNIVSVPAIKLIGLGLSLLIWGSSNMIMGWASGTFGLFNLKPRQVTYTGLNYTGVAVAVVALLVFLFVKPEDTSQAVPTKRSDSEASLNEALDLDDEDYTRDIEEAQKADVHSDVFLPHIRGMRRFALGASLALGAGVLFGSSFDPSQYIIDHSQVVGSVYYGATEDTLSYVFAHFTGIFLTSLVYFMIYCIYKSLNGQVPELYPESVLPAFVSGALWAVAMIAWFVANGNLKSFSITFPIVTSTPGLVAALWGVLVFGEIKGRKNLLTLTAAFLLTLVACLLIAMSM